jgi:hypothetical protein
VPAATNGDIKPVFARVLYRFDYVMIARNLNYKVRVALGAKLIPVLLPDALVLRVVTIDDSAGDSILQTCMSI